MKNIISILLVAGLLSAIGVTHAGTTASGKITEFHQNSGEPGRGLCIQMVPAIPTGGWACLSTSNALYEEITALLLTGYATGNNCAVNWNKTGANGFADIAWASCYSSAN